MLQRTYLDANAGAPLLPEARDAAVAVLQGTANASSVHTEGRSAHAALETARAAVAASVGGAAENVIFTSSATEAAALALTPRIYSDGSLAPAGRLYVGATEHPCVLAGGRFPQSKITVLPVEPSGRIDLGALEEALAAHDESDGAPYVALMLANNETGIVHRVAEAAQLVKSHGGYMFCDAVQALGRIAVDITVLGVDFLALSAHKIGGPQGAGALVLADEAVHPEPLLTGGGQERRRRAGTENVAAIAGFGVAARAARYHLQDVGRIASLREKLEQELRTASPEVVIFGADADRLPNTTLFALPGLAAETAIIAFDLKGVAVSAGSACSSGKVGKSHVLEAMGVPDALAHGGIRVSLTDTSRDADVDTFIAAWRAIHDRAHRMDAA